MRHGRLVRGSNEPSRLSVMMHDQPLDVVASFSEPVRSPRRLDALSTAFPIRSVAAGEKHSLAVGSYTFPHSSVCPRLILDCATGQGEVWGWGLNRYGQLGLEDDVPRVHTCHGVCHKLLPCFSCG